MAIYAKLKTILESDNKLQILSLPSFVHWWPRRSP